MNLIEEASFLNILQDLMELSKKLNFVSIGVHLVIQRVVQKSDFSYDIPV